MKIAQIAPLIESVPPRGYGGTERVVSWLTEELVRRGHEVTLFASGDSVTTAELVPCCPRALRLDDSVVDRLAWQIVQLHDVRSRAAEFDLLHFHVDYLHYPFSRDLVTPSLTTLHGRLDLPDLVPLYERYRDVPVISISDAQRAPLPDIGWCATVYHGLPTDLFPFQAWPAGYLAFLGRISPEKRVDRAIAIAERAGRPLRIAAKVDSVDRPYFDDHIAPLLRRPGVEFLGEIGDADKSEFLGQAAALLFPIDWPEPFGLVMVEAMACGTPVVAWPMGSVPEIIDDGVTGYVAGDLDSAVEAVDRAASLDRAACRRRFEERFRVERMAEDYERIYATRTGLTMYERTA